MNFPTLVQTLREVSKREDVCAADRELVAAGKGALTQGNSDARYCCKRSAFGM